MKIIQKTIGFLLFLTVIFCISCQESIIQSKGLINMEQTDETFSGYNDLLVNSQTILWGSSIEKMKNIFPNAIGDSDDVIYYIKPCDEIFNEYDFNREKTIRFFSFMENQLYWVGVSYGQYSNSELDLLREDMQKKYGIFPIEDNGTIEEWYLEMKEYNSIVFTINKLQNNTLNASYMNPFLRDKYWKESIIVQ